jgi:hypothetical protein
MTALARASVAAGERFQAALDVTDAEAHQIQRSGVARFRGVWSGTDISALEVEEMVRLAVHATVESAGLDLTEGANEWRRLAGIAYRMLLTGVLAGRDMAG